MLPKFASWTSPLGLLMTALLAEGTRAAVIVLVRRVGAGRKVDGTIIGLDYPPELHAVEGEIRALQGWPGHRPGQFAFVSAGDGEHAHPFTMTATWNPAEPRLIFVVTERGDDTRRLPQTVRIGQHVKVEGPYGCFTFDDDRQRQIWLGGGTGITPFIAWMKQLAMDRQTDVSVPRDRTPSGVAACCPRGTGRGGGWKGHTNACQAILHVKLQSYPVGLGQGIHDDQPKSGAR